MTALIRWPAERFGDRVNRARDGGVQPAMASMRMFREHRFTQRRLSARVDGELSPRERRRVDRHAAECPECGPVLRGMVTIRAVLLSVGRGERDEPSVAPAVLETLRRDAAAIGTDERR